MMLESAVRLRSFKEECLLNHSFSMPFKHSLATSSSKHLPAGLSPETEVRQVRLGDHELRRDMRHGHFEAYNYSYFEGGAVIETATVLIVPD